jgi:hypothetical protein
MRDVDKKKVDPIKDAAIAKARYQKVRAFLTEAKPTLSLASVSLLDCMMNTVSEAALFCCSTVFVVPLWDISEDYLVRVLT